MNNYKEIIILSIILLDFTVCYSQRSDILKETLSTPMPSDSQTINNEQIGSRKFQRGIILTLGAGARVYETSFVLAPSITAEIHKHINITTGVDIHFKSKNKESFILINIIPNYVLRIWDKAIFQIGAGFTLYIAGPGFNPILYFPILSTKFDYEVFHNNYLGVELKVFMTNIMEGPLYLPVLLNYSIRL